MHNNPRQSSIYNSLISSVGELHNVNESIKKDKGVLSSFTDYLNQNEAEISKFGKASGELCSFLNNYDFSKGFLQIEPMHRKVEALHPLRLKLAKMGEEAKKLAVFPDRYGSKKAIEVCRGLALACMERMSLDEINKVSELVGTNTGKLLELQKKFDGDGFVLNQINEIVNINKNTLIKYRACFAELQQYINGFPHAGEDNLAVVEKHIEVVRQIDALIEKVGMQITEINSFCDRYNKNNVVARFNSVVSDIYAKMVFSNAEKYKSPLNDVSIQAQSVVRAFENEKNELLQMQLLLKKRSSEIWKNDNERLIGRIDMLLEKDSRKVSFDLNKLKGEISDAKMGRSDLIRNTIDRYPWLSRSNYSGFHSQLISKYISSSEYLSEIDVVRVERNKKIWKTIGKVLLYSIGIPLVIIGGAFYLILKVFFSSSNDD